MLYGSMRNPSSISVHISTGQPRPDRWVLFALMTVWLQSFARTGSPAVVYISPGSTTLETWQS
jgi:hypothetical protein